MEHYISHFFFCAVAVHKAYTVMVIKFQTVFAKFW